MPENEQKMNWLLADLDLHLARQAPRFALCVGLDQYGIKGVPELTGCADDARQVGARLKKLGFHLKVLTDQQATLESVATALGQIGRLADSVGSTIVYFHSGHGFRGEFDRRLLVDAEWDHRQESLVLFNGLFADDALASVVSKWPRRATAAILVDACHGGGLGPDLMRRDGPTLFVGSSEEDATSMVASNLRAGGYLSSFFRTALDEIIAARGAGHDAIVGVGDLEDALLANWPAICCHHESMYLSDGRPTRGRQWPTVYRTARRELPLI